ncbi:hypothetical protein KUCAC02_032175, partial [Chaenocephalus aceratus]
MCRFIKSPKDQRDARARAPAARHLLSWLSACTRGARARVRRIQGRASGHLKVREHPPTDRHRAPERQTGTRETTGTQRDSA